jgi:site-specific DNA recombinase
MDITYVPMARGFVCLAVALGWCSWRVLSWRVSITFRSENRALLVASIARGRRWLDELIVNPAATTESIAGREGCTARKINMTISLAFLAPDLVKAAIDGRLPHGMGVVRLADLSAEWSRQHQMLGLPVL